MEPRPLTAVIINITAMVTKLENPPNRIREQRQARRLSLQAVADRLGTTRTQVHRFETGERDPDLSWLRRIATALGTDVGQLLNPEDNPYSLDDRERAVVEAMRENETIALTVDRVAEGLRETVVHEQEERKRA